MPHKVFIDGQAGTTGLDIASRLAQLPGLFLIELPETQRKDPIARQQAMHAADLAILCLPDAAAVEAAALAAALGAGAPKLLDASTSHRTHPDWTYGFAELAAGQAARIGSARRVANPGCYATAAIALLRPLTAANLLAPATPLSITGVSGYSGGGRAMIEAHQRDGGPGFEIYGLGLDHKHLPEIALHAGLAAPPLFIPSVAHVRQGLWLHIPLVLGHLPPSTTAATLHAVLADYYAGTAIQVAPANAAARPRLDDLAGTDTLRLCVFGTQTHVLLTAQLDNLGKGAAGAALQNTKLMLGL